MVKKLEKISEVEKETTELLNYNIKCMKDLQKLKIKSGLRLDTSPTPKVRPNRRFGAFTSSMQKRSELKNSVPSQQSSGVDLKIRSRVKNQERVDSRQKSVKFEGEMPLKPFAPVTTHLDIVKENKIMRYQLSEGPQRLQLEDDTVVMSS